MSRLLPALLLAACLVSGCGSGISRSAFTYASGDKATAGPLIYNVIDVHILPQLAGDDPSTTRTPQNRFFLIKITASNSSSNDVTIPSLTLIDDHGKTYPEIADGTNVPDWIGVLRRVEPGQTESGVFVFDAPAQHYRLRLTDETDPDIGIDVPLNFLNESAAPAVDVPAAPATPLPTPRQQ